jgi:hypothetical protein
MAETLLEAFVAILLRTLIKTVTSSSPKPLGTPARVPPDLKRLRLTYRKAALSAEKPLLKRWTQLLSST